MKNKYVMKNAHILVHAAVYLNVLVFVGLGFVSMPVFAQSKKYNTEQTKLTKEVPDVILVKVKKQAQPAMLLNVNDTTDTGVSSVDEKISKKNKKVKTEKIVKPSKNAKLNSDLARWTKIKVENPGLPAKDVNGNTYYPDVDAIIADLKKDPNVETVVKDAEMSLSLAPNDQYYNSFGNMYGTLYDMWGLRAIGAEQAWDITTGSSSVIVGIVDTGIDNTQPDITPNMWHNPGEIQNNGIDDDGNGYIDDYYGWNFYDNNKFTTDNDGHGTHVAGTVAASGNNSIGITGISWNSKVMALRVCNPGCSFSGASQAMQYAADMGAKVTNNSYGGGLLGTSPKTGSSIFVDAIQYAHDKGVTTVAAAGNSTLDTLVDGIYPADDQNIITVGASDTINNRVSFSNYGEKIDVMAPGVTILSIKGSVWNHNSFACPSFSPGYCAIDGTSMASPHVAGVAALLYSINPSITPEEVRQVIRSTALDVYSSGKDSTSGYGVLQAGASVAAGAANVLSPYLTAPTYRIDTSGQLAIKGSVNGPNFSSYKLEIGLGEYPSSWVQLATSNSEPTANATLATINTFNYTNGYYAIRLTATNNAAKTYEFTVYQVHINNTSDSTAPTAPTSLLGTPQSESMSLSWTASTDVGGSGVQNYIVKRGGVTIGTPTSTNFADSGLTPSTSYTYSVEAVDYAGNTSSSVSNSFTTLADTTGPSAPTSFTAQTRNKRSIALGWASSTDNVAVTGYRIYRGGSLIQTILSNSWTDNGLIINTAYAYGIEAFDAAGNTSARTTLNTSTLADTTPPSVSFSAPSSGAVLRRQTSTIVVASDDEAVSKVELYRGATLVKTLSSSPYTSSINLITLANGAGSLKAVATDTAGNTAESILPVTIANPRRGDITNDNLVNIFDLSSLLGGWNQVDLNKDLDGNDVVNIFDLSILLYEYGK